MTMEIWVPGIGNTVTFDGALIPPGGYLVSPPSTPSQPASAQPSTTPAGGSDFMNPAPYQPSSGGGGGGSSFTGGFYNPAVVGSGGYTPMTPQQSAVGPQQAAAAISAAAAAANATSRNARLLQKQNNRAWANDPNIRAIEEKSWDIYVDTGRWDTPEQLDYHQQAEAMRKALNPMYKGSSSWGPITQADENGISLPQIVADPVLGKVVTLGAFGLGAILLLGFLKG